MPAPHLLPSLGPIVAALLAFFSSIILVRLYYHVKPMVPRSIRLCLRRWVALRKRRVSENVWPILESASAAPAQWPGWPRGEKLAFVLTHDVESKVGVDRVKQLAEIEMSLGFRSSFNFIPEGSYDVPAELREWLTSNGFEVGVHDHRHDGKLYQSWQRFRESAERVNHFLDEWGAGGFRSGFMLRNLDWIREFNILYDASTFDTDPFEPQPDGVRTIFPFWVPGRKPHEGFVEMPYTLAQDSTVFNLFGETTSAIWRKKLAWIAGHQGMALVNVHPDYVSFNGPPRKGGEFSVAIYREFLEYVNERYGGSCWKALPREVAVYARQHRNKLPMPHSVQSTLSMGSTPPVKIWIDLDNTPHVPFFIPILRELERRGHSVVLTARDAFQVCELADKKGLGYIKIGKHYGKNAIRKILGLAWRSMQLIPFWLRHRPDIALSHGARSQILLSNVIRIPTILISDYEFSRTPLLVRPKWEVVPDSLPFEGVHSRAERVRKYSGIKEDVYAPEFRPDPSMLEELGLRIDDFVVTIRPPASEAHYHNPESEQLLNELMTLICGNPEIRAVMLPRNKQQGEFLRLHHPDWFANGKTVVPAKAVDGLNLLWFSDLVVSGGGTMNREAAALGVPVYSIFRGKTGAVDQMLEKEGRLTMVRSVEEVRTKILFKRRDKTGTPQSQPRPALQEIVDHVEEIVRLSYPNRAPEPGGSPSERMNETADKLEALPEKV
jgi:predicted glycosyltransferase